MLIASSDPMQHIADRPWEGWQVSLFGTEVTLMSSGIATMILVGIFLVVITVPIALARRAGSKRSRSYGALEGIVVFVRDMIARPALHERTYMFLPYLVTLFVFILSLNLFGMIPLRDISKWAGTVGIMSGKPIGGTATSIPMVCVGLGALTLLTIIWCGLWRSAQRQHTDSGWPLWTCIAVSPVTWLVSMSPPIPGAVGKILLVPLAALELVGVLAKCFALVIRLVANMMAGHILLAVIMAFALEAASSAIVSHPLFAGVTIVCVLAGAAVTILDLLVACLQAYIFTFLTAMFLGLYVDPAH